MVNDDIIPAGDNRAMKTSAMFVKLGFSTMVFASVIVKSDPGFVGRTISTYFSINLAILTLLKLCRDFFPSWDISAMSIRRQKYPKYQWTYTKICVKIIPSIGLTLCRNWSQNCIFIIICIYVYVCVCVLRKRCHELLLFYLLSPLKRTKSWWLFQLILSYLQNVA